MTLTLSVTPHTGHTPGRRAPSATWALYNRAGAVSARTTHEYVQRDAEGQGTEQDSAPVFIPFEHGDCAGHVTPHRMQQA